MVMFRRSFCETGWCIGSGRPQLTEHPGAEDDTKSWQGAVDVGVRVLLKMVSQSGFKVADLLVELDHDVDRGTGVAPNATATASGALSCSPRRIA